jgi:hypothetical protein
MSCGGHGDYVVDLAIAQRDAEGRERRDTANDQLDRRIAPSLSACGDALLTAAGRGMRLGEVDLATLVRV